MTDGGDDNGKTDWWLNMYSNMKFNEILSYDWRGTVCKNSVSYDNLFDGDSVPQLNVDRRLYFS